jgi:hypothetical protein
MLLYVSANSGAGRLLFMEADVCGDNEPTGRQRAFVMPLSSSLVGALKEDCTKSVYRWPFLSFTQGRYKATVDIPALPRSSWVFQCLRHLKKKKAQAISPP